MKDETKEFIGAICVVFTMCLMFFVFPNLWNRTEDGNGQKFEYVEESLPVNVDVIEVYEVLSPTTAMSIGWDNDGNVVFAMLMSEKKGFFRVHQVFSSDSGVTFVQSGVLKSSDGNKYPILKIKK